MPPPVFGPALSVRVLWARVYTVKEMRPRTSFKLCGEWKDIIKTITEFREREIVETAYSLARCVSDGPVDRCTHWWCPNPWNPRDVRRGRFHPGP